MPVLDAPAWQPAVADVAANLVARTMQPNGQLAGTFNSSTKPTDVQVTALIVQAVGLLRPRLGPVPQALQDQASAICALRVAMMVERTYFPEQVAESISPYNPLRMEFREELTNWDKAARGEEPNGYNISSLPVGTLYPGYATGTY